MGLAGRVLGGTAIGLALLAGPALAATGDLDTSFGGDGIVNVDWGGDLTERGVDLALAPDGRIVIVATSGVNSGAMGFYYDFAFARMRANGDLDSTFGSGGLRKINQIGYQDPEAVALQPDGKVVAAGVNQAEGRAQVVRLEPGGTPDSTLGASGVLTLEYGGDDSGHDVAVQPDGKILVAGEGGTLNSATLTRLGLNGLPDPSFNGSGTAAVEIGGLERAYAVAIQRDGKIVIAGYTTVPAPSVLVARFTSGGTPDPDFGTGGRVVLDAVFGTQARDVAIQPDGKILLATFGGAGTTVGRLNSDGKPDTSFDDDGVASVNFSKPATAAALALQADGKIVVGADEQDTGYVARLQPSGLPDATFHGSGKAEIEDLSDVAGVAIQPDGAILLIGGTDRYGDAATVVRLQGDSPGIGGSPGSGGQPGGKTKTARCAGRKATIVGTKRANRLKGTRGNDVIVALGGNDKIDGGRGNDLICAGDGNDTVKGGPGKDRLYGQSGKDTEAGGDGNDRVDGGAGDDRLVGDSGKDALVGGSGKDRLSGGGGSDSCNGGGGKDRAACERARSI